MKSGFPHKKMEWPGRLWAAVDDKGQLDSSQVVEDPVFGDTAARETVKLRYLNFARSLEGKLGHYPSQAELEAHLREYQRKRQSDEELARIKLEQKATAALLEYERLVKHRAELELQQQLRKRRQEEELLREATRIAFEAERGVARRESYKAHREVRALNAAEKRNREIILRNIASGHIYSADFLRLHNIPNASESAQEDGGSVDTSRV